eukprot:3151637-Alexandrium_andersonii.AAC.1
MHLRVPRVSGRTATSPASRSPSSGRARRLVLPSRTAPSSSCTTSAATPGSGTSLRLRRSHRWVR